MPMLLYDLTSTPCQGSGDGTSSVVGTLRVTPAKSMHIHSEATSSEVTRYISKYI